MTQREVRERRDRRDRKAVTIRDVAERAQVSVATASRALNGLDVVTHATRDRIERAALELGFAPSQTARRLSLGRTMTVGLVVSYLTRPQAIERLRGVDEVFGDGEFDLVVYNVESVTKRDHYLATLLDAHRHDGVLIVSLPPPDPIIPVPPSPIPVVYVDVHVPAVANASRVIGDDTAGGALAARHLLELGHREIGVICDAVDDPFGFTSSRDRLAGITAELAGAGVSLRPERLVHGEHGRYAARELALRMLQGPDRPTAIVATSDTQALGVLAAAHEAGLNVPEDLSVIGYDDIEAAEYVGLTTVRQQLAESGRRGAELLAAAMDRRAPVRRRTAVPEPAQPTVVELPAELIVRSTTASPQPNTSSIHPSTNTASTNTATTKPVSTTNKENQS